MLEMRGTWVLFCSSVTITRLESSRLNGLTESVLGRTNQNTPTSRHILEFFKFKKNFFNLKDKLKLKQTSTRRNKIFIKEHKSNFHLQNQDLENWNKFYIWLREKNSNTRITKLAKIWLTFQRGRQFWLWWVSNNIQPTYYLRRSCH